MEKIADWTEEKKAEFANRWADPEDKHLPKLCAEFGISVYVATKHFGSGAPRKYPRKLSPDQWKELSRRWYDRFGGTAEEIVSDFDLTLGAMRRYLPPIMMARDGRRATELGANLSSEQLEELRKVVVTGEFTTYNALAAKYDGISPQILANHFGKLTDLKQRVVAPNCPPSMSKSQYDTAKRLWNDPCGPTCREICKTIGVSHNTLVTAFGPRGHRASSFSLKAMKDATDEWYRDPLKSIKGLSTKYNVPYRNLVQSLPATDPTYKVLSPVLFDAISSWFMDPTQTIATCAERHSVSDKQLARFLPNNEDRERLKARHLEQSATSKN